MWFPKVSIITATFNALDGLIDTIASVRTQGYTHWEHIVVDGGSSDGTVEWLSRQGESLKWISEPDHGIADAMNKGVLLAKGDWILVLHSEDLFLNETSLERAVETLDPGVDIVSHHVLFRESHRARTYTSRGFNWWINFKPTIPHQGAFTARPVFDKVGLFDPSFKIGMDYDFFLRAHRLNASVIVEPKIITVMPATGQSSRRDWTSLRGRFREERRIQTKNSIGLAQRVMYAIYWPPYLVYRKVRHWISWGARKSAVADPS